MFVFAGESGKSTALVRRGSPIFAPTVAKTVATGTLSVHGQLSLCPILIAPTYVFNPLHKGTVHGSIERPRQEHGVPMRFKEAATELGKDVVEALRDIVVMVAGEAAKRAIWG